VLGERTSVGLDVHARSVAAAAIDGVCGVVAAPSKLQRPSGDRVKTDRLTELAGIG
jgi:hypothetical protein